MHVACADVCVECVLFVLRACARAQTLQEVTPRRMKGATKVSAGAPVASMAQKKVSVYTNSMVVHMFVIYKHNNQKHLQQREFNVDSGVNFMVVIVIGSFCVHDSVCVVKTTHEHV